jgi:hypothetical protein
VYFPAADSVTDVDPLAGRFPVQPSVEEPPVAMQVVPGAVHVSVTGVPTNVVGALVVNATEIVPVPVRLTV